MEIDLKRRMLVKCLLTNGIMVTAVCAGLFTPRSVLANWPKAAFEATSIPDVLTTLLGSEKTTDRRFATKVKARPHMDDGGTQVTVTVTTTIPNIDSITLLTTSNPTPLVASFRFGVKTMESLTTRIRMDGKGEVIAIIKSGDRLFSESVDVDFSGCGCG
jgi:sulfur-oxidizing protein SoxY